MKTNNKFPKDELVIYTTTTDLGDKHVIDNAGVGTFWTEFEDAAENAEECEGVVLNVRMKILSVTPDKDADWRVTGPSGFIMVDVNNEVVNCGATKAEMIKRFNAAAPEPFGSNGEQIYEATKRLMTKAEGGSRDRIKWKMRNGLADLKS